MPAKHCRCALAVSVCHLVPPLSSTDGYQGLDLENNTIGILVSTAVELSIGGKTLKPAGAQGLGDSTTGLGMSPSLQSQG